MLGIFTRGQDLLSSVFRFIYVDYIDIGDGDSACYSEGTRVRNQGRELDNISVFVNRESNLRDRSSAGYSPRCSEGTGDRSERFEFASREVHVSSYNIIRRNDSHADCGEGATDGGCGLVSEGRVLVSHQSDFSDRGSACGSKGTGDSGQGHEFDSKGLLVSRNSERRDRDDVGYSEGAGAGGQGFEFGRRRVCGRTCSSTETEQEADQKGEHVEPHLE